MVTLPAVQSRKLEPDRVVACSGNRNRPNKTVAQAMTAAKCDIDDADTEDLKVCGLKQGVCSTQRVSETAGCWQFMSKRKWQEHSNVRRGLSGLRICGITN
jgi:hypothetical protein